jgi:hypothetical protein
MTQPFGIAPESVSIPAAFTACLDCFDYVNLGRRFGQEFETSQLALNCARLRLSRWGEAVQMYDDPRLGNPKASTGELQNAKQTLFRMLLLFENSAAVSRNHRVSARSSNDLAEFSVAEPASAMLSNKMSGLVVRRQRGDHILKTAKWALFEVSQFKHLMDNIPPLIRDLEALFTAAEQQAHYEIDQLHGEQQLRLLASAAQNIDEHLRKAAHQALMGHQYRNIQVKGRAMNGDVFSQDWKHGVLGRFHMYDGVVVVEQGGKALNGNQYGGTSFWES